MTFDEYAEQAMINKTSPVQEVVYPAIGAANEAGELLGKIKKRMRDHNSDFADEEFIVDTLSEAGDVLWYLTSLAEDLGSSLEEVARVNLIKIKGRRERGTIRGSGDHR
jgi:NTP pyrophosphatase (non-canonical NTP hydrolase)